MENTTETNVKEIKKAREDKMGPTITIDYKTLNSGVFSEVVDMLANQSQWGNFQAAYNWAKFVRQFNEELKTARELYAKWTAEYTVKDVDGNPKMAATPLQYCPFELKEGMTEKFNEAMENFLKTTIAIQASLITVQDLGNIRLSPAQLLVLEPVLHPTVFAASEKPETSKH
jgi:hypothetical protein